MNSLLIKQSQDKYIDAKAELERVVVTVKFLAERALAFQGNDQVMGILELLFQVDPFLAAHLEKYSNKGRGWFLTCLLLCDQLIVIIGKEIKTAKYSISVDSTPDINHSDKLCCIF